MKNKNIIADIASKITFVTLFICVVGALIGGWVMNIINIANMIDSPLTGKFVLMVVGIFVAPLGVVLGWVF